VSDASSSDETIKILLARSNTWPKPLVDSLDSRLRDQMIDASMNGWTSRSPRDCR